MDLYLPFYALYHGVRFAEEVNFETSHPTLGFSLNEILPAIGGEHTLLQDIQGDFTEQQKSGEKPLAKVIIDDNLVNQITAKMVNDNDAHPKSLIEMLQGLEGSADFDANKILDNLNIKGLRENLPNKYFKDIEEIDTSGNMDILFSFKHMDFVKAFKRSDIKVVQDENLGDEDEDDDEFEDDDDDVIEEANPLDGVFKE